VPRRRENEKDHDGRDRRGHDEDPSDHGHEAHAGGAPGIDDAPGPAVVPGDGDLALPDLQREGGEGHLVAKVVETAARLLELQLHPVQLRLHGQGGGDRPRLVKEGQETCLYGLEVPDPRFEVDELLGDVLPGLLPRLDGAELRELLDDARVGGLRNPDDQGAADESLLVALGSARADHEAARARRDRAGVLDRRLEVVPRHGDGQGRRLDDARPDRRQRAAARTPGDGDGVLGSSLAARRSRAFPLRGSRSASFLVAPARRAPERNACEGSDERDHNHLPHRVLLHLVLAWTGSGLRKFRTRWRDSRSRPR
jgi:hypothetical protein